MQFPYQALQADYENSLRRMQITRMAAVDATAERLLHFIDAGHYNDACAATGVPLAVAAASFEREASSNFALSPAQGDPWNHVSRHVPAGRGPFPNWTAAAIDAYRIDGLEKVGAANWTWARACYEEELFNGFGYRSHGIHSPYLFAGTNLYSAGKFTSDHGFSPGAVDEQLGVMPVILRLVELRPALALVGPTPGLAQAVALPIAPAAISPPAPAPQGLQNAAALQGALNTLGADPQLAVDGNYGRQTKRAVISFQLRSGLGVDGIAGPATWGAINQAIAQRKRQQWWGSQ